MQEERAESEAQLIAASFARSLRGIVAAGGWRALFAGAVPRVLFFGPAAMIFFSAYDVAFDFISDARDRGALWFS